MDRNEAAAVEPPQVFKPLPDRTTDGQRSFYDCLAEVFQVLGLELPPAPADQRGWEDRTRAVLRKACAPAANLPEQSFAALLKTAVHDPDPSFNRQFIEPARDRFGLLRVRTALLEYLQLGTNAQRAGAARAWYWARFSTKQFSEQQETGQPESGDSQTVLTEWNETALREFVTNEDLDVRRCILPGLRLNRSAYPPDLHPLVTTAISIARSHPDDYIRHRIEHQVGS